MKKFRTGIVFLLFAAFLMVNISNSFYGHYHTLEDGRTIFHSHFYQSHAGESNSSPEHNHTKNELQYIFNLNNIFNVILYVIISFIVFTLFLFISYRNRDNFSNPFFAFYNLRAPPVN